MTEPATSLPVEHLFTVTAELSAPTVVAGGPIGTRALVNVTGGHFEGPRLRGTVVAGADWVVVRPNGALGLDVRVQLETDDGEGILMLYNGVRAIREDGSHAVRTAPRFEAAADGAYGWLNDVQGVATGEVGDASITYVVYALM